MEIDWDVILSKVMPYARDVVLAILVLIVGRWIAGKLRLAIVRSMERGGVDASLSPFLSGLAYYLMMTFVLLAVLGVFGIQTTSVIAILGAAGLAVGLAMQGTLSNFAAGVMLLIFRPFKAGDFVEAGGSAGTVQEIGIFATTLHTADNVLIIVPNSAIYGGTVKNFSANDTRRNDMVVGIGYGDNIGVAVDTIKAILTADERVLSEPAPVVAVSELGDSAVNLVVRPWCRKEDYWGLRFDLQQQFKERLELAGCSIPYPQQDVHIHGQLS